METHKFRKEEEEGKCEKGSPCRQTAAAATSSSLAHNNALSVRLPAAAIAQLETWLIIGGAHWEIHSSS